jgi:calcineurin-like phosphoesterase family protein
VIVTEPLTPNAIIRAVNVSRWLPIPLIAGMSLGLVSFRAQQITPPVVTPPPATVRAIEPPATGLPEEPASAGITRFSFVAYGDTRSANDPSAPGDGTIIQLEHSRLVDRVISRTRELASTQFPIRFVLQSGDAVLRGTDAAMWNVSFNPIVERLTRSANIPYFFAVGNHDVPGGEGGRAQGLQNTLAAMSKLIPAEGSSRRLNGYPTYAFGYGNSFFIALDSNVPDDALQIAWVRSQLEHLDRARYRHVIVFFHHPAFSSGPHSRTSAPGSDQKLADRPEAQTATIRNLWLPVFRKHHVDLTITGHDHLFDHWVEHYVDRGTTYRMDHIVTGGGGAPIYTYAGEPDLHPYLTANAAQAIRLDHPMKPGTTIDANPHHFVTIRVDGNRLSLEVTGIGPADYKPYNGRATVSLSDGPT